MLGILDGMGNLEIMRDSLVMHGGSRLMSVLEVMGYCR